jgi:uncharacterized membrane protein
MARHSRFLIAFALGLVALALSLLWPIKDQTRILIGAVSFFATYLALMLRFVRAVTPAHLRQRAETNDEGLVLITILAVASVAVAMSSIYLLLNGPGGGSRLERVLAFASVPLGWASLHTVFAFHYAHLFYRPDKDGEGGLAFPETPEPGAWDFLYFATCIGMAAQVSDVTVTTAQMRQTVTLHAICSFFFNAVILALAVNAAITAGGS